MDLQQQIESLLSPPTDVEATAYFQKVVLSCRAGVQVKLDVGNNRGKGLIATRNFERGDTIWLERPLVGMQHLHNKYESPVCSHCFKFIGPIEELVARKIEAVVKRCKEPTDNAEDAKQNRKRLSLVQKSGVKHEHVDALMSGTVQLPHAESQQPPKPVPCRLGCGEQYCSTTCEEEEWGRGHCLLCTGGGSGHSSDAGPSSSSQSAAPAARVVHGVVVHPAKLREFVQLATDTNDTLLLAAKLLARVLLQAAKQLEADLGGHSTPSASSSSPTALAASAELCWQALQSAWLPVAVGWKGVWWECVACPADVHDEQEFRNEIKQLATDSLQLLSQALHDPRFPALFDARVFGSIVGMFELNNLSICTPTPVEDYFLLIDDLKPAAARAAAMKVTQPLLDALDKDYDSPCEGTAFYALQSCANHSCKPNAQAEGEPSGEAILLARQAIKAGEEVTICYIDEEMNLSERQGALQDYGFTCTCERCVREAEGGGESSEWEEADSDEQNDA